jgi:hypothetical protein
MSRTYNDLDNAKGMGDTQGISMRLSKV